MSFGLANLDGVAAAAAGLQFPKGDPGGLREAATAIGSAASTVSTTGHMVGFSAAAAPSWEGEAATSFRGAVTAVQSEMSRGSGALERSAGALKKLADEIETAQEEVTTLAGKVQDAEEAADEAEARAALANIAAAGAGSALELFGPDPPTGLVDAKTGAEDAAAGAERAASTARSYAADVREKAVKRAKELCDDCERQDRVTATVVEDAAAAAPTGTGVSGMPGARYASSVAKRMTVSDFKELAFLRAGIDPTKWNPEEGLDANDEIVRAVYAYYKELGLERGEFQWMKMAAVGGPLFYAGFKDMDFAGDFARTAGSTINSPFPGGIQAGPGVFGTFEGKFLTMQKAIFSDLAWQHEAFALGGAAAIRGAVGKLSAVERPAVMDPRTARAWEDIESIDPERVAAGNFSLIEREQGPVIQYLYDEMDDRSGFVTGQLTDRADTPIPGSETYREYSDEGNIANYDDRIDWIRESLWPAHQETLSEPGAVEEILGRDFDSEVDEYRQLTPEAVGEDILEAGKDFGESLLPDPTSIPPFHGIP